MSELMLLIAGLFLPLFPLSMVFNELFSRITDSKQRIILLLVWPQIGLLIAAIAGIEIPDWIMVWALLTAMLYGFRSLVLREVSLWVSFIATSVWAVLWVVIGDNDASFLQLMLYGLGFSIPLALLVLLSGELEQRFGAAYAGLYNGLALTLPRLSGVLVMIILAVIATPLFPAFTAMISAALNVASDSFAMALAFAVVWFIWGWSGARLIQGMIIGPVSEAPIKDISAGKAWSYAGVLSVLAITGTIMMGGLA